ncbi:unannotated protein [freshwater metagenome]|uniref:Unannotated protein n=1 Tax=freshwater metagenome TaxID=449393 RepID=A0A6J7IJK6_9ZZZZ|nr:MBL fold metallo-hydrolase [Actinomycetota bacterium]
MTLARAWTAWQRPRAAELLIAALVAGLLLGPRAPVLLPVAGVPLVVACAQPAVAAGAGAALLAGAVWARLRSSPPARPRAPLGHVASLRALLTEAPRATSGGRWRAFAATEGARILLSGRGPPPAARAAGDVLQAHGVLREPRATERWVEARGAAAVLDVAWVRALGRRGGAVGALDGVRRRAQAALGRTRDAASGALLRGMVLGDDARLSSTDRDLLRRAGLGHLVAASGANVALLAVLASAMASAVGAGRRTRLALVLVLTALYVPLAGSGPSIRRAAIMGGAATVAAWSSRPVARRHALLLAAALTLIADPRSAGDPGWQMSFAAVAAIALLAPPIARGLGARGTPRPVAGGVALSAAAGLGTAPVAAAAFGTVSLASLPANVLAAPLVPPATWLGMVGALAAQVDGRLAAVPIALAAIPAHGILIIGRWWGARPLAQIAAPWWSVLGALLLVSALALALRRRPRLGLAVACAAVICVLILPTALRPRGLSAPAPGVVRVSFLDIGQGDATVVQVGTHALLVDAGPPGAPLLRELGAAGVTRLDALVGTHAQADHIGGADDVLRAMPVGMVLDGRGGVRERQGAEMAASARGRGVRLIAAEAGEVLLAGGIRARVLWPPAGPAPPGADPNDRAVVLLVEAAGLRLLLAADAESDVLARLELPPIDILKVSHHGSDDPGLAALLERLRPRLAVIEVGRHNTYGHPTPSTLRTLARARVPVRRTDLDGTVRVEGSGASGLRVIR